MFTDIVGYPALMEGSERAGVRARERHRSLVRSQVEQHHGEYLEQSGGDETLSSFPSALDAVRCTLPDPPRRRSSVACPRVGRCINLLDVAQSPQRLELFRRQRRHLALGAETLGKRLVCVPLLA